MATIKSLGEYKIPTYAVCYLEYGDAGGLLDSEIATIDQWLESEFGDKWPLFNWRGESFQYFTNTPAFGLPCEVEDCEVVRIEP